MPMLKPSHCSIWLVIVSLCLTCTTLVIAQGTGGRILGRVS